jgi:DNA-binding NtrC family response regulator
MRDLKRVLVVDDDPDARELLASLTKRSLHVDLALDRSSAIGSIRRARYDVVLAGAFLPDIMEAMARVAGESPVLIVLASPDLPSSSLEPRVVHGVIRKPFDAEELAVIVEACASARGRGSLETMALVMAGSQILAILASNH